MVLAAPLVTAEHVYARVERSSGAALIAVDATSGRLAWTFEGAEIGPRSSYADVAVANGRAAVPARQGDDTDLALQAIDARTGAPLWRVAPGRAILSRIDQGPFLAADDSTIFLGLNRAVLAFEAGSGALRFELAERPQESGGQVWLDGPTLYRRGGLTTIVAYDAATGAPRWTYHQPFEDPGAALRAFRAAGESLYAFCACEVENRRDRGWLLAIDTRDGRERWRAQLDAYIELYQDAPAIGSQTVIVGSEHEDVIARSAADGTERWRFRRTVGRSVAADGQLVFATDRGPRWRHWLGFVNQEWH
jgi:outer membrane protein assembly factor BamB